MLKRLSKNFALIALIALVGLSPMLTQAKENNKGKGNSNKQERQELRQEKEDEDDEDEDEEKNEVSDKQKGVKESKKLCLKAFGHLIAPGYIKKNGEVNFFSDCVLPFGIAKKLGNQGTSTADTTAPVISNVVSKTSASSATIAWITNEKSNSTVFVSLSSPVSLNTSSTTSSSGMTKTHKVVVKGLLASTTYHAVVRSIDKAGNVATSSEFQFTTKAQVIDSSAPVISSVAVLVSTSTVNVHWMTNENATSRVYFGTSSSLNVNSSSTAFIENVLMVKDHNLVVPNLSPATVYYFAIESKDTEGNRAVSPVFTVTTGSSGVVDVTAPVISSIASSASSTSVGITWNTNESATSKLFFGTTSPLVLSASSTNIISSGTFTTSHSLTATGLATGTPYRFVVQSTDSSGNIATSMEFGTSTTSGL